MCLADDLRAVPERSPQSLTSAGIRQYREGCRVTRTMNYRILANGLFKGTAPRAECRGMENGGNFDAGASGSFVYEIHSRVGDSVSNPVIA
jgi:hypothetical protein